MTSDGTSEIFSLAAEFPAATRENWLKLVTAALKGAPFDKLVSANEEWQRNDETGNSSRVGSS